MARASARRGSALPAAELDRLYPDDCPLPAITPQTITDPVALRQELTITRQRGYATDYEESTPGLCCIVAPVFGSDGAMSAAISVSAPGARFTPERQADLRGPAPQGARRLSHILGYHPGES